MIATCLKTPGANTRQQKAWVGTSKQMVLGMATSASQKLLVAIPKMTQWDVRAVSSMTVRDLSRLQLQPT